MKTVITILMMLALVAISGCQSSSPRGGRLLRNEEGFKIGVPTFSTTIKQGEFQAIVLSVKRDDYFKQNVRLEIRAASKGINVEPTEILVNANDKPDVQLQISANQNAALGEYQIAVKGIPERGEPTSTEFKVQVVAP